MENECPFCGNTYKSLGHHYARSNCEHPNLTEPEMDLLKGLLMGDGTISTKNANPYLRLEMINEDYINYLAEAYPHIFGDARLKMTAEQSAEKIVKSGFRQQANADDYSNVYVIQTYSLPDLNELAEWYDSGKKVFPSDLTITPELLKAWVACDGNINQGVNLRIGCSNEVKNQEKLREYFATLGVEPRFGENQIWFTKEDSNKLYDFMGEPPDGFKYKWP